MPLTTRKTNWKIKLARFGFELIDVLNTNWKLNESCQTIYRNCTECTFEWTGFFLYHCIYCLTTIHICDTLHSSSSKLQMRLGRLWSNKAGPLAAFFISQCAQGATSTPGIVSSINQFSYCKVLVHQSRTTTTAVHNAVIFFSNAISDLNLQEKMHLLLVKV